MLLVGLVILVGLFWSMVILGYYQEHKNEVNLFYYNKKELVSFTEFCKLVSRINFDIVTDSPRHMISRCGKYEILGTTFIIDGKAILFSFFDFSKANIFILFKKNKNILNFKEKTTQELIILRGLPGSGKSTEGRKLVSNGIIHSTDDVMTQLGNGNYSTAFKVLDEFGRPKLLGTAHKINEYRAKESMAKGITPVIIDNTNLNRGSIKPYVKEALRLGYHDENIKFIDVGTGGKTLEELAERNEHNVSLEMITTMYEKYKNSGPIDLKKLFENGKNIV